MTVVLGRWDKGVDFLQARVMLENILKSQASVLVATLPKLNKHLGNTFIKNSVAYIQLMNGARVSEALEALRHYIKTKQITFKLPAKKTKVLRPFRIPELIQVNKILYDTYSSFAFEIDKHDIIVHLKRVFGWNSHSLRYAFIRYAIEKGYSAEVLALILGHKKIDTTLNYSRNIRSESILEKIQE
jgi:Phage integrase family.